jgi:hypothetical protein
LLAYGEMRSFFTTVICCLCVIAVVHAQLPDDAIFAEFQLSLSTLNYTDWPLPGFSSTSEFLAMLGAATIGIDPLALDKNASCTRIFGTVVVTVMSNSASVDASVVAQAIVRQVNNPNTAMQTVMLQGQIASANFTQSAIAVPPKYHAPQQDNKTLFMGLGGVGVFLMVAQFLYGLFHFRGFDFITAGKDER